MGYVPITPFRRAVDAAHLARAQARAESPAPSGVDKWEILRELGVARLAFGLTDRALTVLQALLSFHQGSTLGDSPNGFVVHPSNASICERLNGMPCSTMRRHLAALVASGLVARRDSPNGKRFVRRYSDDRQAFGFDLSPLAQRFEEIVQTAEAARAEAERHERLRRTVSLMRRDLASLVEYGPSQRPDLPIWDRLSDQAVLTARALRRKLSFVDLQDIEKDLLAGLEEARAALDMCWSEDMSTNPAKTEQHYQNSNKDPSDPELCIENANADPPGPPLPLGLVLTTCAEIHTYAPGSLRHWHDLVRAADIVRPMLGISASAWSDAVQEMGPENAAIVLAAMLERMSEIKSPGGYLRALTRKASEDGFSPAPMVMALMRSKAA